MNLRRFNTILSADVSHNARRSIYWIWAIMLVLMAWGFSTGAVRIESGDSSVGGVKAHLTSQFAVAQQLSILTLLVYGFFSAVAAGMAVIHDDECRVGEILHATPLTPGEYIWGKYGAVLLSILTVLAIHISAMMITNHGIPGSKAAMELRGAFVWSNYLRPVLIFTIPTLVLFTGVAFGVGEWTRRPILVFFLPVAVLLACIFFLWNFDPSWLDPRLDRLIALIEPTGFRWLRSNWLKVDRGANFYNTQSIPIDGWLIANRLLALGLGLGFVASSRGHLARLLRGAAKVRTPSRSSRRIVEPPPSTATVVGQFPVGRPLALLQMTSRRPGLLAGAWTIGKAELRELLASPGLYLFAPLLVLEAIGPNMVATGPFDTSIMLTPGLLAARSFGPLTTMLCLLLMFYTVESFNRDRATRLAAISMATPVRTGSILLGKALANGLVGVVVMLLQLLTAVGFLLYEWKVGFRFEPFALIWGILLVPTLLAWSAFVMATLAITGNRYTTYAISLGVIAFTSYRFITGAINWVGNWALWGIVRWSDISVLERDRYAFVLNRTFVLGLFLLFTALAIRFYPRRATDSVRTLQRLQPWSIFQTTLRLSPFALVPIIAGALLYSAVYNGAEGESIKGRSKNYWRKNLATYKDWPLPDISAVDLTVDLHPETSSLASKGTYTLINRTSSSLRAIPVSPGFHWKETQWTLNGKTFKPEDREGLQIFALEKALEPQQSLTLGFSFQGQFPLGISSNGGNGMEFIVPTSAVLTSFSTSVAPRLGFQDGVGVDEENQTEAKEYADNYFEGPTESFIGGRMPFKTKIKVTGPAEFQLNSVGVATSDTVVNGRRETVWESDQPVQFFNIIAGRWAVRKGNGTAIYYDPRHAYNLELMAEALDASRKYYSEWFTPYPWKELKLSEFPALADYAQGFPTDITFSESIGFLTKNDRPRDRDANAAFLVTAHEAAHQWWGNIVAPGRGPGGNILSEGTAHFSTMLLFEQVKGLKSRITFATRIEDQYSRRRRADSERPMVKVDGSRDGDTTVTYEKAGFVFWMLLNHMGRERMLKGIHAYFDRYKNNSDHPVLQDFVAVLREFADDVPAYDDFTKQWFFQVVMPEYQIRDAKKEKTGNGWEIRATVENIGTGRMPLDVVAVKGERFLDDEKGTPNPEYREARITLNPKPAGSSPEPMSLKLQADFEPEKLIVDPDAKVLQLRRKAAVATF